MDGAGWRWVEVDAAGLRRVHGLVIPIDENNFQTKSFCQFVLTFKQNLKFATIKYVFQRFPQFGSSLQ